MHFSAQFNLFLMSFTESVLSRGYIDVENAFHFMASTLKRTEHASYNKNVANY